jgi:hypothetical protein
VDEVDEDKEGGGATMDVPPYLYWRDWPIKDIGYVISDVMVVRAVK